MIGIFTLPLAALTHYVLLTLRPQFTLLIDQAHTNCPLIRPYFFNQVIDKL